MPKYFELIDLTQTFEWCFKNNFMLLSTFKETVNH